MYAASLAHFFAMTCTNTAQPVAAQNAITWLTKYTKGRWKTLFLGRGRNQKAFHYYNNAYNVRPTEMQTRAGLHNWGLFQVGLGSGSRASPAAQPPSFLNMQQQRCRKREATCTCSVASNRAEIGIEYIRQYHTCHKACSLFTNVYKSLPPSCPNAIRELP